MSPRRLFTALLLFPAAALLHGAGPEVRDLGIPVKSVSWVKLHPGRGPDGGPSLLASMGQNNGGLFVLDINLATGHCGQSNAPEKAAQYPTASFRSPRTGVLYIGTAYDGHLLRYGPGYPRSGLQDLGAIDGVHATFPTGIDEAPDGSLWIGAYPDCSLTRFDPATGHFTHFGSMDDTDHYAYPLCGADGTIAVLTKVVHPHLVFFDATTGKHWPAIPTWTNPEDKSRPIEFFKGLDGLLYVEIGTGQTADKFRMERVPLPDSHWGGRLMRVSYLPARMPGIDATYKHAYQEVLPMPGGVIAGWADGEDGTGMFRKLVIRNTNPSLPSRTVDLDWRGSGSNIFMIHQGPDGLIYGSSFLPEHLFRCAPDGSGMVDLGRCSLALGEAYTMGNFSDGTMAIGSYVDSLISLYDPRRRYNYAATADGNPRDLGQLDDVGLRPIAMTIVPALKRDGVQVAPERMWIGSLPYYGFWGGTLAWLDPKTGAKASHRNLLPDCSPFSLLWLPDRQELLVGISAEGGTGTSPKATHGAFVLWDPVADRALFTGDFGIKDIPDVVALAPADHGLVYALLGHTRYTAKILGAAAGPMRLALVDPAAHRVISDAPLAPELGPMPDQCQFCLFRGPDGVYGMTERTLYRVKPGTCETEIVWRAPLDDQLDTPGPWIGRTFLFATGWRLRALTLP